MNTLNSLTSVSRSQRAPARPSPLPLWIQWRSNLIQAPPFILAMAFFGSLSLLVSLVEKHGRAQQRIARWWARVSVFFSGCRLEVVGAENFLASQPAVYAANHTSYMDTPVVFASLPFQFRILAKTELWKLPFIGWYLDRSGQIPINTANPRATLSSLAAGVKALRSGMPLFVFPEGARTPNGELQPFLSGAAFLAIRAQVPLVPIALIGVYNLLPIHTTHFYPGKLTLAAGKPIATAGKTIRDAEEVTLQLRESIACLIQAHS